MLKSVGFKRTEKIKEEGRVSRIPSLYSKAQRGLNKRMLCSAFPFFLFILVLEHTKRHGLNVCSIYVHMFKHVPHVTVLFGSESFERFR
jgi:hypothetical protein